MGSYKAFVLADNITQLLEVPSTTCYDIAAEIESADIDYEKLYDDFHSGGWYTATLYAPDDGRDGGLIRDGIAKPTPLAGRLPSTRSYIESLDLDFLAVRIALMNGGSYMWEHRDYVELDQSKKKLRLHVPLVTNPAAAIHFPGRKVHMASGWLWKLDPTVSHAASNSGSTPRMHLILDCYVNENLRKMLDQERLGDEHVHSLPALGPEECSHVLKQAEDAFHKEGMAAAEQQLLKTFHEYDVQEQTSYDILIKFYHEMGFQTREKYWIEKLITRIYNRDPTVTHSNAGTAMFSKPYARSAELPQVHILEQILKSIQAFNGFERGFVRGSLARGTADLQSDIDLLCEVSPEHFAAFITEADACIKCHHMAVADAMVDTIAKDFGGIGLIYMLNYDGNLYQLDLYITCQGRPWGEACGTYRKEIYRRGCKTDDANDNLELLRYRLYEESVEQQIQELRDVQPSVSNTLLEINVIAVMLKKCLERGDIYVASSEYAMWKNCFIKLIRWRYDVQFRDYGFYHVKRLAEQIGDGGVIYNDLCKMFNCPLSITNFRAVHQYAMRFAEGHLSEDFRRQQKLIDSVLRHIGGREGGESSMFSVVS